MTLPVEHTAPLEGFPHTALPREGRRRGRWLVYWDPEDTQFWSGVGSRIARRNLAASVLVEHVCYGVFTMWSALVLFLGPDYGLTPAQKFTLVSIPAAVGGLARIPYTLAVTRFGGRNWTIISALLLLIPSISTALLLKPGISYPTLLLLAALAGLGGGGFASSMSNINGFFPDRAKGLALGINAAGGNLGVAVVQLVGLVVLATAGARRPALVVGLYIPLLVLSALLAYLCMDNLPRRRSDKRAMREAARLRHTWVISLLYVGTFGSFIGFGFAFGQVLLVQFPDQFDTPIKAAYLTFLGPLIGALTRPVGGRLADRLGGAQVSTAIFLAMTGCATVVLAASIARSLPLFLAGFFGLFITAGLGNGSTYKMIPAIFRREADERIAAGAVRADAEGRARRRTTAVIGIAGAVGAFGGVGVNIAFRESFQRAGNANAAFAVFAMVYLVCAAVTYLGYVRVPALPSPPVPRPAFAAAFTALGGSGLRGAIAHCTCSRQRVCSTCQ